MMKKIPALLFAAVMTCLFSADISFTQTLPFKHYSVEDGLVSSSVNCIFQDSRGFLWIGTQSGLSRFNGIEFQNFSINDGLRDEFIECISEDNQGNIWFGTSSGGVTCFTSGKFKTYGPKEGLPGNRVFSLVKDQEGNMWLGTSAGACKFNGKSLTVYTEKHGLIDNFVKRIVIDKRGTLWFGTEKGISCFKKGRFTSYTTNNGLIHNMVQALMTDHQGNIWIGTQEGLSCFCRGTFTSYSTKNGMPNNTVRSIVEDINGNLWIGTDNGASYFSSGNFTNYYTKQGLLNDKIYTIFVDREGNIWFGTSMGLSKLQSLKFVNFSIKDGLPNNLIWAIIEENAGKYWIGTDKGLSRFSRGKFTIFTTRDGMVNERIFALMKDRRGNIWIGTDGGLSVFSAGNFTNYTTNDGLAHNTVLSLLEDKNGVIWIGTLRGLCRFINGKITAPGFYREPLPILVLLEDKKGDLWFSNTRGLCKFSGNKLTQYFTRDGLIHQSIFSMYEDSRGRLWIGTRKGLSCFFNGEFTNYTTADGLSHHLCYFILEDNRQNLWIGTGRGVNRFDGKHFKTYTSRDGLASDEMGQKACLKDSSGNLWFGTIKGITRFNPVLDRVNTVPPQVYITHLNVFGKNHSISPTILLKYNQNYLGFSFIGLSFTSSRDVSYRYRLEGMDREWFETKNRYISYTYLPPGTYTFKVIAKNNDGIESVTPAETRFIIRPPFWKTWWFLLLSVFSLLSLLVLIGLWRIKREKEKIANEARNKQLVVAQKMELLGILAGGAVHDLKNLLSIIIGYSKIAVQQSNYGEEKIKPIENIKYTAVAAVQVVKQILAFTRQKYDETVAANLPDLLDDIIEILKVTTPVEINIHWKRPQQELLSYINPTKFQQVVMNLCLNAVQAITGEGEIKISLYKDHLNQIILEVSDTGSGIEKEVLNKIFDPLFTTKEPGKGTGLGLFVVKRFVDEQKGRIEVLSQPGEGTTFKLAITPSLHHPSAEHIRCRGLKAGYYSNRHSLWKGHHKPLK
jgi:ligand-binding sensor domain-containing protein/two-component sensor histidine kinase